MCVFCFVHPLEKFRTGRKKTRGVVEDRPREWTAEVKRLWDNTYDEEYARLIRRVSTRCSLLHHNASLTIPPAFGVTGESQVRSPNSSLISWKTTVSTFIPHSGSRRPCGPVISKITRSSMLSFRTCWSQHHDRKDLTERGRLQTSRHGWGSIPIGSWRNWRNGVPSPRKRSMHSARK